MVLPIRRKPSGTTKSPAISVRKPPSKVIGHQCAVVGIGASAGGLEAFTRLLARLPATTGLGFVLVQHLDPQHESVLAQILSRATTMPVEAVTNNQRVEADHVYVIPPDTGLTIADGILRLHPRGAARAPSRCIDTFLESLAQDQKERAIGVILSGSATDGTLGLEAIRAEGGITFAQDHSASHDSMPRSAIGGGCVDFVLSPEMIAKELTRIARHRYIAARSTPAAAGNGRKTAPGARGDQIPLPARGVKGTAPNKSAANGDAPTHFVADAEAAARDQWSGHDGILLNLRNHTGVDFSLYKAPTIHRRIARRMVLNRHDTLQKYGAFLKGNTKELDALYSDALINVTSFFRNAAAFEVLQRKVFPELLRQGGADPVRVWVLGCSTGQEAYSIAMAFAEVAEKSLHARKLQVFATDLNEANLVKARNGLYTMGLAQDVTPERLRRFFVEDAGAYRVIKSLREQVVFARQNILSDPPFSRMDLISCRNLMIYLEPSLQKKVLPTFHYALKPEGFLFLGASESISGFTNLFEPVDKKQKIFSKKAVSTGTVYLPIRTEQDEAPNGKLSARTSSSGEKAASFPANVFRGELNAEREADRLAGNRFAPPGVLINAALQILQFRGATGAYLEAPTGKASFDLLKMARKELMLPLRAAINRARKENRIVRKENVPVEHRGKIRRINLEVVPLKNLAERHFLIWFVEPGQQEQSRSPVPPSDPAIVGEKPARSGTKGKSTQVADLEHALGETREYLQTVIEEHETASEEIQAAHEEGQSANEELQSLNEELETSKEELESTNEELTTVNEEMANRNIELIRLNSDLTNLQTSTRLSIVLLGPDLTIRRFSAQAEKQFNLLATDVGRPFRSVRHDLDLPNLEAFIADVIANVHERECEVRDKQGHWFALHVRPYLTLDGKVDGAVVVLVDITVIKESERAVIGARDFAEAIISTARDPFLILDADFRVQKANDAFYATFKVSQEDSVGRTVFELDNGRWDIPKLRTLLKDILPRQSFFNDFELTHNFEHIGHRTMLLNARTLIQASDHRQKILLGIQDISELLHFQNQIRHSELRYRRLFEAGKDGVLIVDAGSRKIIDANPYMTELLGYSRIELLDKELFEIGLLEDENASRMAFEELQRRGFVRYENLPLETKTGQVREVEFVSNLYQEGGGEVVQCNIRDITARRRTERELSEKARLVDLSNDAIIVCDNENKIRLWSKGAERLYGWKFSEVFGRECHSLLQTDFSKPKEEIDAQFLRDGEFNGEVAQIARDGRRVQMLCRWVLDESSKSVFTSYTDITAIKASEGAMMRERDKAIDSSRTKDDFLAALSHELRMPLNPVLLIASDGAGDGRLTDEAREAFSIIEKNVRLEARLIDDLLDLNKIAHGKMHLDMQRMDIHSALHDAITTMGREFDEKSINLTLDPSATPCFVDADPVRLQQVFWNVLKNAQKFTPVNGTVHVQTRVNKAADEVTITVKDSGIGMTVDELGRVFVAFSQGDHAERGRSHRFGGLGLGLAISRTLVQLQSGRFTASSEGLNLGSTFSISLPLAQPVASKRYFAAATPFGTEMTQAPRPVTAFHILVVEDHDATRRSLAVLLTRRGHQIETAATVAEALARAEASKFDFVISDLSLPDGDGCDLMQSLRQRHGLRGIAMTGYGMEQDVARSVEAGFVTHLTKPVSIQSLDAAIASFEAVEAV